MKFLKIIIFIFCLSFLFCGFSLKKKSQVTVAFSREPISEQIKDNYSQTFNSGEKIYYLVNNPKGFKCDFLRIRILKKDDKVNLGGFNIKRTIDMETENGASKLSGEVVLHEKGLYILQVYEFCNPTKILVNGVFRVE